MGLLVRALRSESAEAGRLDDYLDRRRKSFAVNELCFLRMRVCQISHGVECQGRSAKSYDVIPN